MKTIISVQPSSEMDIYILEVVDRYDYSDSNRYEWRSDVLSLMDVIRTVHETEEELVTPYSTTFYFNLN